VGKEKVMAARDDVLHGRNFAVAPLHTRAHSELSRHELRRRVAELIIDDIMTHIAMASPVHGGHFHLATITSHEVLHRMYADSLLAHFDQWCADVPPARHGDVIAPLKQTAFMQLFDER
jgi:hypothetical protein